MPLASVNASHTLLSLLGPKQRSQDLLSCCKPYQPEVKLEAGAEPPRHRSRSPRTPSHQAWAITSLAQGNPLSQVS